MMKPGLNNRINSICLFFIALSLFVGCRYDSSNRSRRTDESIGELKNNLKDVYYRFPSPDEMFSFIENTGLTFNPDLLLEINNNDRYLSSLEQSLILGVYTSDVGYIRLFGRYKQSIDYLQAVFSLSERLRISGAFNKSLILRAENNIKNSDSLKNISEEAFTGITNYLAKNNQENIFAVVSAGSFIEFMHLAISISGPYSENNITITRIADQKAVFENIVNFMEDFSDDPNVEKTLMLLMPLIEFYNFLPVDTEKTTVTKTSDNQLVFGGKKKNTLSEEDYFQLKVIISEIRSKIVTSEL
jgi:hypothetical protein